jgi:steroid 5-alpha reductase family enzyme
MNLLQLALLAAVMGISLSMIMAIAWQVQRTTGHTGWIDVCWTFGTGIVSVFGSLAPLSLDRLPGARQILVAVLVALWSLRLGGHILLRTREVGDDPRYRDLITHWGANANLRMFLQLQAQAAVGLVLAVSVALAANNTRPHLGFQDFLGLALLVGALAGEAVSDWQLRRFKSEPANRGRICETGLWSLSRHPNYFFEWLCWLAYPLIAIDLSGANSLGWITLLAPACMYWVLVHVSGIPPLEAHMLRTRGAQFHALQARTRAFFPIPKSRHRSKVTPPA